jgi:2'-5' RNA ligase
LADAEPSDSTARLFVAVLPPAEVLDRIAALRRPVEPGVRYTPREQWHVTLHFFGKAVVADAIRAFERVVAGPAEAVLGPQLSRLGRNAVVIPVAGLDDLARAVAAAMAGVGEPPEGRRFTGHLTIARLKNRPACGIAGDRFEARFPVSEIHLVRSHLHAEGARHETIATICCAEDSP